MICRKKAGEVPKIIAGFYLFCLIERFLLRWMLIYDFAERWVIASHYFEMLLDHNLFLLLSLRVSDPQ